MPVGTQQNQAEMAQFMGKFSNTILKGNYFISAAMKHGFYNPMFPK